MPYQSLRTLREELTGIRLAAANTSLWSIAATINQRARSAVNDAVRTYPFYSRAVYSSAQLPSSGATIPIPTDVERIISIEAVNTSTGAAIVPSDYRHVPTGSTNLLTVYITRQPADTYFLKVSYERRMEMLPENRSLAAAITDSLGPVTVQVNSPGTLVTDWEPQGYLELSNAAGTAMEVCYYNSINPAVGFNVVKGQLNTPPLTWALASSITVSPVVMIPPEATAVIMAAAEANMYSFWLSHRALYDQYTALTGLQTLDVAELLGIVRTTEDRADRRYKRLKKAPPPTRVKVGIRGDR